MGGSILPFNRKLATRKEMKQLFLKYQTEVVYILSVLLTIYALLFHFTWSALLVIYLGMFLYGCLGLSINNHRYLSHKTFEYRYKWMEKVFSLLATVAGTGSPLNWVEIHIQHHRHADTEKDPHSPRYKSYFEIIVPQFENHEYKRVKRMLRDPFHVFLHRKYWLVNFTWWAILYLVGGMWLFLFLGPVAALATMTTQFTYQAYLTHKFGYRNYDTKDDSRNAPSIYIFDFGEALHNNHHAKPNEYNYAHKKGEFDFGGWLVKHFIMKKD